MMQSVSFEVEKLRKTFNRQLIFTDVSFMLRETGSLVIAGKNGSGKSTLLKILVGVLSQTKGSIKISLDGKELPRKGEFRYTGFVSPYLQLYDEFTAWENLVLINKIRCSSATDVYLTSLLERVNLTRARNQLVKTFSSGMKQRLKYAFALIHKPPILMLDEPTANLDSEGKEAVHRIITEQKQRGIVIVATNEPDEIAWCDSMLNLDELKGTGK